MTVDEGVSEDVRVSVGVLLFVDEPVVDEVGVTVPERDEDEPFVMDGVGVEVNDDDNELVPDEVAVLLDVEDGVTLGVAVSVVVVEGVTVPVSEFDGEFDGVLPSDKEAVGLEVDEGVWEGVDGRDSVGELLHVDDDEGVKAAVADGVSEEEREGVEVLVDVAVAVTVVDGD